MTFSFKASLKKLFNIDDTPLTVETIATMKREDVSKKFFQAIRKNRSEEVAVVLGKFGDALTWTDAKSGMTPVVCALSSSAMDCFWYLLEKGGDKNATMGPRTTERLINRAITDHKSEFVEELVKRGADLATPSECLKWTGDSRNGSYRTRLGSNMTPLEQARALAVYKHPIENTKKDRSQYRSIAAVIEASLAKRQSSRGTPPAVQP